MDFEKRRSIREGADILVRQALEENQCELLLRQMAETFIDAIAERGARGRHELRRLTDICLAHERSKSR